jgi:hypothetical protein
VGTLKSEMNADIIRDERIVLESMFEESELKFESSDVNNVNHWSEINIRLTSDAWLKLTLNDMYPLSPLKVSVVGGSIAPTDLESIVTRGQSVADAHACLNEVSAYETFSVVHQALEDMVVLPTEAVVDCAQVSCESCESAPPSISLSTSVSIDTACVGVSLRFVLRFAEENGVLGWDKFEAALKGGSGCAKPPTNIVGGSGISTERKSTTKIPNESTASVCSRAVVPITLSKRCTYVSLEEPQLRPGETAPATHFVSHAWGAPFASLATALYGHQVPPLVHSVEMLNTSGNVHALRCFFIYISFRSALNSPGNSSKVETWI